MVASGDEWHALLGYAHSLLHRYEVVRSEDSERADLANLLGPLLGQRAVAGQASETDGHPRTALSLAALALAG